MGRWKDYVGRRVGRWRQSRGWRQAEGEGTVSRRRRNWKEERRRTSVDDTVNEVPVDCLRLLLERGQQGLVLLASFERTDDERRGRRSKGDGRHAGRKESRKEVEEFGGVGVKGKG